MNRVRLENSPFKCGAVVVALLFALPCSMSRAGDDQEQSLDLLITGGWVFQTQSGEFVRNSGIAVHDGRIVSLQMDPGAEAPEKLQLEDGHYILPGLIDLHAHYNMQLVRRRREEFEVMPIQYLANGVTVTFPAGEFDPDGMRQLRQRMERGEQAGPRLINSGPYFGRARPGWNNATTAEQIHREVDFWVRQGVGGFKAKAISPEHLGPLIERAHHHGLTVTGHLDSGFSDSVNPRDAIDMGIDRIEHFLGGDAMTADRPAYSTLAGITAEMPEFQRIVQKYVDAGTVFDATITAYGYFGLRGEEFDYWIDERQFFTPFVQQRVAAQPRRVMDQFERIYQAKQKTIAAFWKAGGMITLGTDHFSSGEFLPGFGAHRELDALVRAGIPAAEAIKIGTINGAKALGIERDHGSINQGKVADMFVVQGNPLDDIRNSRKVEMVLRAGKVYRASQLRESILGRLGPASQEQADSW